MRRRDSSRTTLSKRVSISIKHFEIFFLVTFLPPFKNPMAIKAVQES